MEGDKQEQPIKVSVLCLAYNHERYIRDCLEGFVMQKTNFPFEVLVHDDASTDGTAAIIREYEEKYPDIIKPIYQTENQYSQGIKISKTHLLPKARGKYIAFCEGDDYWVDPLKLQKQYEAMEKNTDCSMCVHTMQYMNENGSLIARYLPLKERGFQPGILENKKIKDSFKASNTVHFHTSTYFLRREWMLSANEMQEQLSQYFNGDESLWRIAIFQGDIYYIPDIMSHYRRYSIGSWTSRFIKKSREEYVTIYKKIIKGEMVYNKLTKDQFMPEIRVGIVRRICDISAYSGIEGHNMIKQCKIRFSEILTLRGLSLKNRIRLLLCRFMPKTLEWIDKKKNEKI